MENNKYSKLHVKIYNSVYFIDDIYDSVILLRTSPRKDNYYTDVKNFVLQNFFLYVFVVEFTVFNLFSKCAQGRTLQFLIKDISLTNKKILYHLLKGMFWALATDLLQNQCIVIASIFNEYLNVTRWVCITKTSLMCLLINTWSWKF